MIARLHLAIGGRTIELRPAPGKDRELRGLIAEMQPSARSRLVDGVPTVGIQDAGRLLAAHPKDLQADADVVRAVDNREAVVRRAYQVRIEERHRSSAPIGEARQLIAGSDLASVLDDHQARNVAVMTVPDGWGTPVFDEQGTGKTVTTIVAYDLLVERGEAEVMIVVCPKSMTGEWVAEFRRITGGRYRAIAVSGASGLGPARGADVVVLNYESVAGLLEPLRLLARRTRTILAVDESFLVKNPAAARSQAVASLREWCRRCFVLCGTPAPNSPHDLVAQFDLVDFGLTFGDVHLDVDRNVAANQVRDVLRGGATYLRNLKNVVLPDLPGRTFSEVGVTMAPIQRRAYASALDDLVLDLSELSDAEFARQITSYLERRQTLLRICSDPTPVVPGYNETPAKVAAIDGLLDRLVVEQGEKVVIWSFYRASLDNLDQRFGHLGLVRVDGSVSGDDRREAVRRFQGDPDAKLFLGNPAAAGAGLTLHAARFAIYESMSNQAAHYLQSLDRIHRRGQERPVEYFALLGDGTIEEDEYRRLLDKAQRQADLLGDIGATPPSRQLMLNELMASQARMQTASATS